MVEIGVIILAAGQSSRLGQPKQLLVFRGRTLLRHAVEVATAIDCREIVVVLGTEIEACRSQIPSGISIVENPNWHTGMASSIKVGLNFLLLQHSNLQAVLITVCDQPFISAELFNQLITHYQTHLCRIVASHYGDVIGVPALFDRSLFPDLLNLSGDMGARKIIQKYQQECQVVAFPQGNIDVDTMDDYDRLNVREIELKINSDDAFVELT
jgi:molybdenum cofactor cytidylyltransferase